VGEESLQRTWGGGGKKKVLRGRVDSKVRERGGRGSWNETVCWGKNLTSRGKYEGGEDVIAKGRSVYPGKVGSDYQHKLSTRPKIKLVIRRQGRVSMGIKRRGEKRLTVKGSGGGTCKGEGRYNLTARLIG